MVNVSFWKQLWDTWDLRIMILLSLLLQIYLIFSAPLRKRMSTPYIFVPMWLAYLLADITANFALGLISKSQWSRRDKSGPFANPALLAFWAPFLLIHLGGPDTITALALEDNELWLRHLLGLGFQCWAVAYAFFESFPNHNLWLPTVLIFIAGFIKYTERTRALYLASSRPFRNSLLLSDPSPHSEQDMIKLLRTEARSSSISAHNEVELPSDLRVVQCAYGFFEIFKGLIADLIFSFHDQSLSRKYFLTRSARDAFLVVEVELNFFYEILYTKVAVVQSKLGYSLRFIAFSLTSAASVVFYMLEKNKFETIDIVITYILFLGAIGLDVIAFVMMVFSDWTSVALTSSYYFSSPIVQFLRTILNVNRKRWPENSKKPRCFSFGMIMNIVRRRWSESLSQYNLIYYCLHPRSDRWEKIIGFFGLTNMLDGVEYVKTVEFTTDLRDLIFEELKMKCEASDLLEDLDMAKKLHEARGDMVLSSEEGCNDLLPWVEKFDFDDSLLQWHIATELCFNTDEASKVNDIEGGNIRNTENGQKKDFRGLSKLLSDYMVYLLIMQPTMMSTVASINGEIRFRDTCAKAKELFRTIKKDKELHKLQEKACESILNRTDYTDEERDKSVLISAALLAKKLKEKEGKKMWEVIFRVWVELLWYAACRCRAYTHAAQLSKGGQLITLVWLLMTHLGVPNQFQISAASRAKEQMWREQMLREQRKQELREQRKLGERKLRELREQGERIFRELRELREQQRESREQRERMLRGLREQGKFMLREERERTLRELWELQEQGERMLRELQEHGKRMLRLREELQQELRQELQRELRLVLQLELQLRELHERELHERELQRELRELHERELMWRERGIEWNSE
ncbi:hypothetical protein U1Q18_033709 [Sarracenia purpurea var. burkii]